MVYKVLIKQGKTWETYGMYEDKETADRMVMRWTTAGYETMMEFYKLFY